jgi:tetratricopeptide (TPR) repeat protein
MLCFALFICFTASSQFTRYVAYDSLKLRSSTKKESWNVIAILKKGDTVILNKVINDVWAKVTVLNRESIVGYVVKQKLSITNRTLPSPTSSYDFAVRAEIYKNANELDSALEDANKAINLDSKKYAYPYYLRGDIRMGKEQYAEAEEDFIKVLELEPECKGAYIMLGDIKCFRDDFYGGMLDYNKVISFEQTSINDYKNLEAISKRGVAKSFLKDYRGSIKDFDSVINAQNVFYNFNRGLAIDYYYRGF